MLIADNLTCQRGGKIIFNNLCFKLHAGDLLIVEGENGAGKSSLLKMLSGLLTPHAGDIIYKPAPSIHYIHHENGLKLSLTVLENLRLFSILLNITLPKQLSELLSQFKLTENAHTVCKQLSAGQKRRVALIKLLLCPKKIWLLDEPLASIDQDTQTLFLHLLKKHLDADGIAIISTHQAINLNHNATKYLRLGTC